MTTQTTTRTARAEETWQKLNDRINEDPDSFEAAVKAQRAELIGDGLTSRSLLLALDGLEYRLESYVEEGRVEYALIYLVMTLACRDLIEERGIVAPDERSDR